MKIIYFIVISLALLLQGCVVGSADMNDMNRVMAKDNPEDFEAVKNLFIESARGADLEGMMSLTSDVTISKEGRKNVENLYETNIIPFLATSGVELSGSADISHVTKRQTGSGSGWVYQTSCTLANGDERSLRIVVLRENGRIVVAYFGPDE